MKSRLACTLLVISCVPALAAAPPEQMLAPPSFKEAVEVNVVNVDVRVTDKNGLPVTDLRKGDFELFEDGKRVPISHFELVNGSTAKSGSPEADPTNEIAVKVAAADDAWNLVVYVDNFNLHPGNRTRAVRQLRETLSRLLAPGDRVMLVSYDLGAKIQLPFTADARAIEEALKKMEGLAVNGIAIDNRRRQAYNEILTIQQQALLEPKPLPCPQRIAVPAHDFAQSRRDEVLRTLGALTVLVNSLSGVPGRKAVLHVSDGLPASPGEEVFQFLAEICGGGSGTGGIGSQGVVEGNINAPEPDQEEDNSRRPDVRDFPALALDPNAVYDARMFGSAAYQAASQAAIDASSYVVAKELSTLAAHANAQRVTLYTLQATGAEAPAASDLAPGAGDRLSQFQSIETAARTSAQSSLYALASGTGGTAILNANDFGRDLVKMREDFSTFYSLAFSPSHGGDGKEHRLEVRVKKRGLRLRYRVSYRDKSVYEKAVDRTLAALFYGAEENPLKITLEVGEQEPAPGGTFTVPVHVKIPLSKVAVLRGDGLYEGNLRVLVAARGTDGRTSPVRQVQVPIRIPHDEVLTALGQFYVYTLTLQLAPGEQRVAVGVRDDLSANASYLSRAINVGTTTLAGQR